MPVGSVSSLTAIFLASCTTIVEAAHIRGRLQDVAIAERQGSTSSPPCHLQNGTGFMSRLPANSHQVRLGILPADDEAQKSTGSNSHHDHHERIAVLLTVMFLLAAVLILGRKFIVTVQDYTKFVEREQGLHSTQEKEVSVRHHVVSISNFTARSQSSQGSTPRLPSSSETQETEHHHSDTTEFYVYLQYQLGNWFTYASYAEAKLLVGAVTTATMAATFIYLIIDRKGLIASLYQCFVWLIAPDGGTLEATRAGAAVGAVVSVLGLVIFALLMTMVAAKFDEFIASHRHARNPVLELDHIVILGFTSDTVNLVKEICDGHDDSITIVILSPVPKPEVEDELSGVVDMEEIERKGSRILVRQGDPHRPDDLKLVNTDLCRTVIPMPDRTLDKETRDAYMLQMLAALNSRKWPVNGRILVFCSVDRNLELFRTVGGPKADILNLDTMISSILICSSRQKFTAGVIADLLNFEGSEVHIAKVPRQLQEKYFGELMMYYPQCVLIGVARHELVRPDFEDSDEESLVLCPDQYMKVSDGESLVVIAEDETTLEPTLDPPSFDLSSARPMSARSDYDERADKDHTTGEEVQGKQEVILIVGWSFLLGSMLNGIDSSVLSGTLIISYSDVDIEERKVLVEKALKRHGKPQGFDNIHIDFYKGQLGSVFQLEEVTREDGETAPESSTSAGERWRGPSSDREAAEGIVWEDITRAFVMANDKEQDPAKADAISMTAALQVQTRLEDLKVPVIVELRDASSREVCNRIGLKDVVSSSEVPAQVIAAIELQPVFKDLFLQLFGSSDVQINIKRAKDYLDLRSSREPSFFEVAAAVRQKGHILIG